MLAVNMGRQTCNQGPDATGKQAILRLECARTMSLNDGQNEYISAF
jgi:hypothetical protein